MKYAFLALFAGLALSSCSEISTDPAPQRATRTAKTVSVTYARTASTIADDTVLINPRLDVYVLPATVNANGTLSYGSLIGATPTVTITEADFADPKPISIATDVVVTENTPSTGIRLVLSSSNLPGRRANSQSLTASVVINGVTKTPSLVHRGLGFSKTAKAGANGRFNSTLDTNIANYLF